MARKTQTKSDEIRQAVKDALVDKRLDDLSNQMNSLSNQMTAGFTAVHTRQDIANGKLMNHQQKFDKMDGKSDYEKLIWLVVTTLVGIVTYFLTRG